MAKVKLIRQPTVADTKQIYEFDIEKGFRFLVKNLTDDDIFVSFDENATEDEMILIPSECAQVVMVHENVSPENGSNTVVIIPKATSEKGVEVQCLLW